MRNTNKLPEFRKSEYKRTKKLLGYKDVKDEMLNKSNKLSLEQKLLTTKYY